jgi:hypothetical protein
MNTIINDASIPNNMKCVLQLDFTNSFNSVEREAVFREVRTHFPELAAWVETCYRTQSHLNFGSSTILSCCGLHQGDPPRIPALFPRPPVPSTHSQKRDRRLTSQHVVFGLRNSSWLSQLPFTGPRNGCCRSSPLGLNLAPHKSTIWCGQLPNADQHPLCLAVSRAPQEGFELLGAPIGSTNFSINILEKRIASIQRALDKLPLLQDSQAEFVLLRSCLSLPKFGFCLRTCDPSIHAQSFAFFDDLQRDAFASVLNKPLTDAQ